MNRTVLQIFLLLAFIPLAILVGYGVLVVAPIFVAFLQSIPTNLKTTKKCIFGWVLVPCHSF